MWPEAIIFLKKNFLSGQVEIYDSLGQGKISYGLEMNLPFCLNRTDICVPHYRFNKQKLINLGQQFFQCFWQHPKPVNTNLSIYNVPKISEESGS